MYILQYFIVNVAGKPTEPLLPLRITIKDTIHIMVARFKRVFKFHPLKNTMKFKHFRITTTDLKCV